MPRTIRAGDGDPQHGTVYGYNRLGCRGVHGCPECREAWRMYLATRPPTGHLFVLCWCEADMVPVPRDEVRACLTRSCGAEGCEPLATSRLTVVR